MGKASSSPKTQRAEYRTKDYVVHDSDENRRVFHAVEGIPSCNYTPATEAAAMRSIGHSGEVEPTVTPMDVDGEDGKLTLEDMEALKHLAAEWERGR